MQVMLLLYGTHPWKDEPDGRGHPSESALFAIASKATHTTPALHIVDLTLERISFSYVG